MSAFDDLEAAYEKARADVLDIQTQLAQRKPVGRVPDEEFREYREWSGRAKGALRYKLVELVKAKAAVKKARGARTTSLGIFATDLATVDLKTEAGLIKAAFVVLKRIANELEGDVGPDEQAVIDSLGIWLDKEGL